MKRPDSFLTNTTAPAGRAEGQAINDPGGGLGTGMDQEIYNDPAYAVIAPIESYKDGGIADTDETTLASDMRDALEEMTDKRVTDSVGSASIAEWSSLTTYSTVTQVTWKGFQFVAYNLTSNLDKNPLLFPDFWMVIPKPDDLLDKFFSGQAIPGGLSTIADRAHANFAQNIEYGHYRLGGNGDDFYEFFRVALDGTVVTGDTVLEDDIFKVGVSGEYWNIDIIAPDVVGTRTLLDMGEYVITPQSVSGENDTLGELQEDQFQGHYHNLMLADSTPITTATGSQVLASQQTLFVTANGTIAYRVGGITVPVTDTVNGTPRTGLTTRSKEFTEGASYIIVMNVL